jgi:hypothetical protein
MSNTVLEKTAAAPQSASHGGRRASHEQACAGCADARKTAAVQRRQAAIRPAKAFMAVLSRGPVPRVKR